MVFKNNGPGGCCCYTCPIYSDGYESNGWNVDDSGNLSWYLYGGDQCSPSEASGRLHLQASGDRARGPRLSTTAPGDPLSGGPRNWYIRSGYIATYRAEVLEGNACIGGNLGGILFNFDDNKAYPVKWAPQGRVSPGGSGVDFDARRAFDLIVTYAPAPQWYDLGGFGTQTITAVDWEGRNLSYYFMGHEDPDSNIAADVSASAPFVFGVSEVRQYPDSKIVGGLASTYHIEHQPALSFENQLCQLSLLDFEIRGIGNLKRHGLVEIPESVMVRHIPFGQEHLTKGEVGSCEIVDEYVLDAGQLTYPTAGPPLDYATHVRVTSDGSTAGVMDRSDDVALVFGGPPVVINIDDTQNIPCGMTIYSGVWRTREISLVAPANVLIRDTFDQITPNTGTTQGWIEYELDLGMDDNRTLPISTTDPFVGWSRCWDTSNGPSQLAAVTAECLWDAKNVPNWNLERIKP